MLPYNSTPLRTYYTSLNALTKGIKNYADALKKDHKERVLTFVSVRLDEKMAIGLGLLEADHLFLIKKERLIKEKSDLAKYFKRDDCREAIASTLTERYVKKDT